MLIRDKNVPTVLANSSNHSRPGSVSQYTMHVSNMLTVNFMFCPSKANSIRRDLKAHLAIEMSLNNASTRGKLQRCKTLRGDMQITAEIMQTYDR